MLNAHRAVVPARNRVRGGTAGRGGETRAVERTGNFGQPTI